MLAIPPSHSKPSPGSEGEIVPTNNPTNPDAEIDVWWWPVGEEHILAVHGTAALDTAAADAAQSSPRTSAAARP